MWIFRRSKVYRNAHVRTSILRTFTLLGDNLDTCTCTCIVFVLELNKKNPQFPQIQGCWNGSVHWLQSQAYIY